MGIVATIQKAITGERSAAERTYARLVKRVDTPAEKKTDAAQLQEAMQVLGIGPDVLERHLAARREAAELETESARLRALAAGRDAGDAAAAEALPSDDEAVAAMERDLAGRRRDRAEKLAGLRRERRDLLARFRDLVALENQLGPEGGHDESQTRQAAARIRDARRRLEALRAANEIAFRGE